MLGILNFIYELLMKNKLTCSGGRVVGEVWLFFES